LQHVVRPGDTFVDIGANIGMVTLLARHLVGDTGRVIACEPNPRLRARLENLVARNRLAGVDLVAKALGEAAGSAELHEFSGHTGWGSLAAQGPAGAATTAVWQVPVVRGDDLLATAPPGPMVVKIDVEGFEVPVLRGLRQTLASRSPAVLVEVADAHQRRAGFSAAELCGELQGLGYRGFELRTLRRCGLGRRLQLLPLVGEVRAEIDALFVPPIGPMAARGLG
jgi:FkbM family methyltransferase